MDPLTAAGIVAATIAIAKASGKDKDEVKNHRASDEKCPKGGKHRIVTKPAGDGEIDICTKCGQTW